VLAWVLSIAGVVMLLAGASAVATIALVVAALGSFVLGYWSKRGGFGQPGCIMCHTRPPRRRERATSAQAAGAGERGANSERARAWTDAVFSAT
jgi:hypothetical protein